MSKVTIGCKLPSGILMQLGEPGSDGYVNVQLNGTNSARIVGGFGITENVEEAHFDAWLKKHAKLAWARQGLVFKMNNTANAEARALDHSEQRNGFEPLDPDKMPKGVEPDKEHLKRVRSEGLRNRA